MRILTRIATLALAAAAALPATAQITLWNTDVAWSPNNQENVQDALMDSQGNSYLLTKHHNGNDFDWLVAKYDTNGQQAWSRTIVGNTPGNDSPGDMTFDSTGNLIVTGSTWNNFLILPEIYITTVKLSAQNGNTIWGHTGEIGSGNQVVVTAGDNVFVTGTSAGMIPTSNITSINANGTGIAHRADLAFGFWSSSIEGLTADPVGNAYLSGNVWHTERYSEMLYMSVDLNCNIRWHQIITESVAQSGDTASVAVFDKKWNQVYFGGRLNNKANIRAVGPASGSTLWEANYDSNGSGSFARIAIAPDDNLILSGRFATGTAHTAILKVAFNSGGQIWRRDLKPSAETGSIMKETSMQPNGDLYVLEQRIPESTTFNLLKLRGTDGATTFTSSFTRTSEFSNKMVAGAGEVMLSSIRYDGANYISYVRKLQEISLAFNQNPTAGGMPIQLTVSVGGVAPQHGFGFNVTDDNNTVHSSDWLYIPPGSSSAVLPIASAPVTSDTNVTFSLSRLGQTFTAVLTLQVPRPLSLTILPSTVIGGQTAEATLTMSGPAPMQGTPILVSDNSSAVLTPAWIVAGPEQESESFPVGTKPVATAVTRSVYATVQGLTKTATITILPPAVQSVTVSPEFITGGGSTTGTVRLNGPAPVGGRTVTLTDNSSALEVPASVMVPEGAVSATFNVRSSPVSQVFTRQVYAAIDGVSKMGNVTLAPGTNLKTLTITPSTVKGGSTVVATATLTMAAPAGGVLIAVSDNSSFIHTPTSLTIPQGGMSGTFNVVTSVFGSTTTRQVMATYNGVTKTANITITP